MATSDEDDGLVKSGVDGRGGRQAGQRGGEAPTAVGGRWWEEAASTGGVARSSKRATGRAITPSLHTVEE